MKKLVALSLVLFCTQFSFAQSPQKMSYQSVIRNATGELVVESPVGIQISIVQVLLDYTTVYVETHSVTTNVNGLASLEIGAGTIITGTFAGIDWGNGPYFVTMEIDPSGGTSYSMSATSQLLSVPYALHAKTADKVSEVIEISMDVEDPTSNFPFPWENEGGFVATFENTNTGNGDGIRIKLGKQRTEIVPAVPLTPEALEATEQIRQLLDSETPVVEKQDILEGLILDGIQADIETKAGMAVGIGNLISSFINESISLPLNVTAPINDALDYDFGVAINDGIGLPLDAGLVINDGLGLPWDITSPINSTLGLPLQQNLGFSVDLGWFGSVGYSLGTVTLMPALPALEIPGVPEYEIIGGYEYTCEVLTPSPLAEDFEETPFPWEGTPDQGLTLGLTNFFPGPGNPSAYAMMYADNGGDSSSVWFSVPTGFDLVDNHTFSMKVYMPSGGFTGNQPNDVTLRLQDGDGPNNVWENTSQITKPLALNQWQTITFDFEADNWQNVHVNGIVDDPVNRVDFNRVQVFFNGEYNNDEVVAFMDDFSYDGDVMSPVETLVPQGTYCDYTDSEAVQGQPLYEQATDLRIPGIPYNTLKFPSIPDLVIPAIPVIPEFEIAGVTITPIDPSNLQFWGVLEFDLTEPSADALSDENEFIRFSDADDSKMGSIRAVNKADWAEIFLNPPFLNKLKNVIKGTADKKHLRNTIATELSKKANEYRKIGVEYSSSFGDYAEWLERVDPDERMRAGSIVGVVGGKISKDLTNAEQVMVVSHSPIVLGNIPEEGSEHLGNNIAFVGQVPVKIMGAVHTGDYIIGNPATPGYGYAKGPAEMSIEEVNLAVGRSWEDSPEEGPKMVITVVGVHNGDYVNILKAQAQKLEATKDRLGKTKSKIASLESNMESVLQILSVEANSK